MRITFCLFLCVLFSRGYAQETGKIELSVEDSRASNYTHLNGDGKVKFFKVNDSIAAFVLNTRRLSGFPAELDSVPVGEYLVKYKNYYNHEITKRFSVYRNETFEVEIYPDSLTSYPQNSLANLEDNDSLTIMYESNGCFNHDLLKLVIRKQGENFISTLYTFWGISDMLEKFYKPPITITLTKENLKDFIRFENELNFVKDGGCTTVDEYQFTGKHLNVSKIDGGCNWMGFYYLQKALFGNKKN